MDAFLKELKENEGKKYKLIWNFKMFWHGELFQKVSLDIEMPLVSKEQWDMIKEYYDTEAVKMYASILGENLPPEELDNMDVELYSELVEL